jgi:hypothetical protein
MLMETWILVGRHEIYVPVCTNIPSQLALLYAVLEKFRHSYEGFNIQRVPDSILDGLSPINNIFRRTAVFLHLVRSLHFRAASVTRSSSYQYYTTAKIPFVLTTIMAVFRYCI